MAENTPWRAASVEETVPSDAAGSLTPHCTGPATEANTHGTKCRTDPISVSDLPTIQTQETLPAQRAARPGGTEPQRTPRCCSAGPRS